MSLERQSFRNTAESGPDQKNWAGGIQGTLVLDLDGTLTIPGKQYAVDPEAVKVLANFLESGGNLIFCTGATLERIERSVLTPLHTQIDVKGNLPRTERSFKRVCVMPENGSALLLSREISVLENELSFDWHRLHELHVPDKERLREVIERELVPRQPDSFIAGDRPEDKIQRDYILSWKGVCETLQLVQEIEGQIKPKHPEIHWQQIQPKAARTTIDFVHADSGKTFSVAWLLKELRGFQGPVIGFGDLGDEFARVVPTVNVNKGNANEFRRRGMAAMELTGGWTQLGKNDYVITGEGFVAKARRRRTDEEIQVLRDENGEIIYSQKTETGHLVPVSSKEGRPVEIMPLTDQENDRTREVQDAGQGTAWMIKRLLQVGYFSAKDEQ